MAESARVDVALVADLIEERWPSMDLVADMLLDHLGRRPDVRVTMLRPELRGSMATLLARPVGLDRYVRRFAQYPKWLATSGSGHDVYHVVDHSYAHLVHALPPEGTIVTCHDADAFLPLVAPALTTSRLPLMLVRRILSGMRAARLVTCPSAATRDELMQYDLVPRDRLVVVPNGVNPACTPISDPDADAAVAEIIGTRGDTIDLLHVGTCIPRKRIDRLLDIVARLRAHEPRVRLLKAGGRFTEAQNAQIDRLGLTGSIVTVPFLAPDRLAALYRRAVVVLAPSEREGFGLPVVEAMACGTSVVASDIAVFREVGGSAARYAPLDDDEAWCAQTMAAIEEWRSSELSQARERNIRRASQFSWQTHADTMAALYRAVSHRVDSPSALVATA